jgi:hypothetical protein
MCRVIRLRRTPRRTQTKRNTTQHFKYQLTHGLKMKTQQKMLVVEPNQTNNKKTTTNLGKYLSGVNSISKMRPHKHERTRIKMLMQHNAINKKTK